MSILEFHRWIEERKEFFLSLGWLIGILYGLWQYVESVDRGRVDKTLEFYKEYREKEVDRDNAESFYIRKNEDIIKQGAKTESDTGKNIYRLIFQDGEKNKEILDTILSSAYFYNSVSACAANNVCDQGLSCRLFARSMHNYYSNFGGFFDEYKKEWFDNITSDVGVFLASDDCVKVLNVQKY
ncbi:hypothetical protein AU467_32965 [Mesorhizobium loti]|uniref:Uncharacterized protein n=1 Tax=Rhizobium loti TaxID=381 RepID=A0A101KMQ2_RHILI|nr:hypothetical protein AU467_32965 [Mesorhizobium loti]